MPLPANSRPTGSKSCFFPILGPAESGTVWHPELRVAVSAEEATLALAGNLGLGSQDFFRDLLLFCFWVFTFVVLWRQEP